MPSANKTPNYGLNQWQGNEYPKRQDFVDDNSTIDLTLKENADAIAAHKADKNNPHGVTAAQVGAVPTTRKVNGHALSADVTVTKADVGLSNVNNTSDANKPVSTATQEKINDLAGSGRTTETVKGNADNIAALQSEKANFTKVTGSPDFNALTTTGLYGVATSSYTNGPSGITNWGLLIVDKSGNGTQTFLPDGKLYSAYRRNGNSNGTWNAWSEEAWVTPSQISAWTAKADASTTVNGKALTGNVTITKSDVGLGNVDNTADANKTVGKVSHALTISQGYGGTTGTYDGSAAKTVSVPKITFHTSAPGTIADGELWGVY